MILFTEQEIKNKVGEIAYKRCFYVFHGLGQTSR